MKKFAYILLGAKYEPEKHKAVFNDGKLISYICTVQNFAQAEKTVKELMADGVGAIELCGAFGKERALELFNLVDKKIPISYVITAEGQETLVSAFFDN